MEFTSKWPETDGYYWFIDKEYPQPVIGFIAMNVLHHGQRTYRKEWSSSRHFIRFGEAIVPPACKDIEIIE